MGEATFAQFDDNAGKILQAAAVAGGLSMRRHGCLPGRRAGCEQTKKRGADMKASCMTALLATAHRSLTRVRKQERAMNRSCRELTLTEALSDPLVRTVMAADGVDPRELEATMNRIAGVVARNSPHLRERAARPAGCY